MTDYLIGADVGGTTTRVAVADPTGQVVAVDHQAAGNPNAVGVQTSAMRIRTAIESALDQLTDVGRIRSVVLGLAGYRTAQAAGDTFLTSCLPDRISVRPRIVSDLGVAFASATALPRGYVLIAGTGSATAEIDRGEILGRRGGWGWLLGDEGSGFWLGREAVRHALIEVERGVVRGPLTSRVLTELAGSGDTQPTEPLELLLRVPYERAPVRLAELAPLVTELVDQDPAAVAIAVQAADRLARMLLDLSPRPGLPVVTTGSVLRPGGPIHRAFSERVGGATGAPVLSATSGLVGALWLAAQTTSDGTPVDVANDLSGLPDPVVHERLTASVSSTRSTLEGR